MGYCMDQRDCNFYLAVKDFPKVMAAIRALPDGHYSWVGDFRELPSLDAVLREWRWMPEYNTDGDIVRLNFEGEKAGDEDTLFRVLAPFVKAGSYIEMQGEDGARWRWEFDGTRVLENYALTSWAMPNVDWPLLRKQKATMVQMTLPPRRASITDEEDEALTGVINLLDSFMDEAACALGEVTVFGPKEKLIEDVVVE
jgi:hypothetical protein